MSSTQIPRSTSSPHQGSGRSAPPGHRLPSSAATTGDADRMSAQHRIDVHQHFVPPFYADALDGVGGDPSGSATPDWSPQSAIDMMDTQEIARGVLSLST